MPLMLERLRNAWADELVDRISQAASEFRSALNLVEAETWRKVTISAFPRGACGHCSELLARYLFDELGIEATYAAGDVRHMVNGESHAWLEFNGLYIDISADQFGLPEVIVEHRSALHDQASNVHRHPIIRDQFWATYCAPVYHDALGNIGR